MLLSRQRQSTEIENDVRAKKTVPRRETEKEGSVTGNQRGERAILPASFGGKSEAPSRDSTSMRSTLTSINKIQKVARGDVEVVGHVRYEWVGGQAGAACGQLGEKNWGWPALRQ